MIEEQAFLRGIEEEFEEIKPGSLQMSSAIGEVIDWNSLNAMILLVKVEKMTGVKLDVQAVKQVSSFAELFQLAQSKTN